MDILVGVTNQKLRITTNLKNLIAGSRQFIRFIFELSDEWDGLVTFAQFQQGENAYNVFLDDENAAYLPPEIGPGTCKMMLYGDNGTIIATTNYITFTLDENILIHDAQSTDISKSLYDQLIEMVSNVTSWADYNPEEIIASLDKKAEASDLESEVSRAQAAE